MSDRPTISRRRMLGLLAAGSALTACGGAAAPALAPPTPAAARQDRGRLAAVRAERRVRQRPEARLGPLAAAEPRACSATYVADVVPADEGTTPQAATAAVQKLLQTDKVDIVVGLVDDAAALAVIPLMVAARKLLLVAGVGRRGRHEEGAQRLRLAHVLQRPAAGGAAGHAAGPVRRPRRRLHRGAVRRPGHRDHRGLPGGVRVGGRPGGGHGAARARCGTRAHDHADPAGQAEGDVLALAPGRRRGLHQGVRAGGPRRDDPAVRLRPDHRGRRAHRGGPGRDGRPDHAALLRPAHHPGEHRVRHRLQGRLPGRAELLLRAGLRHRARAGRGARRRQPSCSTATRSPTRWARATNYDSPRGRWKFDEQGPAAERLPAQGAGRGRRAGQRRRVRPRGGGPAQRADARRSIGIDDGLPGRQGDAVPEGGIGRRAEQAERFAALFRALYLTYHRRDGPRSDLPGRVPRGAHPPRGRRAR